MTYHDVLDIHDIHDINGLHDIHGIQDIHDKHDIHDTHDIYDDIKLKKRKSHNSRLLKKVVSIFKTGSALKCRNVLAFGLPHELLANKLELGWDTFLVFRYY